MTNPHLLFIDLFCGAGGVTAGIERSKVFDKRVATVIGCVNHDANAIASHAANHPDALHFTEDIRTLDLTDLMTHTYIQKTYYPDARLCLWASLECTNFSKAKGGLPRDADSRTLAEHLFRYLNAAEANVGGFDYIFIENVEEFMSWGPVDENGKPISKRAGEDYLKWTQDIQNYGYKYDFRILDAADYGDYTSRKRYFGVFAKRGLPMQFPKPTHGRVLVNRKGKLVKHDLFSDTLKPWNPVKEVLDFTDEGESIFHTLYPRTKKAAYKWVTTVPKKKKKQPKKPPLPSEIRRLVLMPAAIKNPCYGLKPAVDIHRSDAANFQQIIDDFCEKNCLKESEVAFYLHDPLSEKTLERVYAGLLKFVANGDKSFLKKYYSGRPMGKVNSTEAPAPTLTTFGNMQLVQTTSFLSYYYSGSNCASGMDQPAATLTTKDRASLVQAKHFIMRDFSNGGSLASIDQPAGAVMPVPKMNLVRAEPWIMSTNFDNVGSSIHEPAPVITANRKWHYLMNPCYDKQVHSIEQPSPTLIARQDKAPLQFVQAEAGPIGYIILFEEDSPAMVRIKEFMAAHSLMDIKMRGLRIPELKRITGFPDSYVLIGNQAEQKKFIGNAVPVNLARAIIESFAAVVVEFDNVHLKAVA